MSQQQAPAQSRKVDVSWPQVVASALAAVSSAVLLSTVGVAGTLIGAAVGSVIATVGTAVYRYSLEASRERVAAAQNAALTRVARARAQAHVARGAALDDTYAQRRLAQAEDELDDAEHDLDQAGTENDERPSWRQTLRVLPWKRVGIAAAAVFAIAMVVILGFELVTGRAVSTYTGGTTGSDRTTLSGLTGGGGSGSQQQTPSDSQTGSGGGQTSAPSANPTQQSTPSSGSTPTPSSAPSQEPSQPDETPTPEPSTAPTSGAPGPVTSSP